MTNERHKLTGPHGLWLYFDALDRWTRSLLLSFVCRRPHACVVDPLGKGLPASTNLSSMSSAFTTSLYTGAAVDAAGSVLIDERRGGAGGQAARDGLRCRPAVGGADAQAADRLGAGRRAQILNDINWD